MASIRVRISSVAGGRQTVIVPDTETIRETLENASINYDMGVTAIDGSNLRPGDMDKSYAELGIVDHCMLSNAVKADNAATVKIVGGVAVVTSAATYDDLTKLAKMAPEALMVVDEDDDPIFAVGVAKTTKGSFDNNAAFFGTAKSADGKATITVDLPENIENAKEWFADKYAHGIKCLNMLEADFDKAVADCNADFQKVLDSIEQA